MFLYHGTNSQNVPQILNHGLLPRGSKNGNYKMFDSNDYESRHDAVYLSDAYAVHYATKFSQQGALIEIDIDSLEEDKFYPDEDFLVELVARYFEFHENGEECTSFLNRNLNSFQLVEDLTQSLNLFLEDEPTREMYTKFFKENLSFYQSLWRNSLHEIGNCCYFGNIPISAISKITTWCSSDIRILRWFNDANNYMFYKDGVNLFKNQDEADFLRLLTKCFINGEFQQDELISLVEKKPSIQWFRKAF